MPAYRSSAEAKIRDAVVDRLRTIRPKARIMHEVNCSLWGPNRIDVLAVSPAEIIAVEVKSEKDKLDRLPAQIASMSTMSHHVIAALHEKHLVECSEPTNKWAAHYERDGELWRKEMPQEAKGAIPWVYPERRRTMMDVHQGFDDLANWRQPDQAIQRPNVGSVDMLRVSEMRTFCEIMGVAAGKRATLKNTIPLIKWLCTGEQITKGVCAILRARDCPEADPPIPICDAVLPHAKQILEAVHDQ